MATIIDTGYIRAQVRTIVDPMFMQLREAIYGSGITYNKYISPGALPPTTVFDGDVDQIVDGLGYIKGIKMYSGGTLLGSQIKELSVVNMGISVAGSRVTIQPRVATTSVLGSVIIGSGLSITNSGVLSAQFITPTTTKGDILVAQTGGAVTRLGIGSNGYVLTADSSATLGARWALPTTSGVLSNPMIARGDMIVGGTSGIPTRMAVGANERILTNDGTDPVWGQVHLDNTDLFLDTLGIEHGGTGADLSATGPGILFQYSAGADISVGALPFADIDFSAYDSVADGLPLIIDHVRDVVDFAPLNLSNMDATTGIVPLGKGGTGKNLPGAAAAGYVLTLDSPATTASFQPATTGLINPMTASGDIIYGGASGSPLRRGIGSSLQVLTVSGGLPVWLDPLTVIGSGVVPVDAKYVTTAASAGLSNEVAIPGFAAHGDLLGWGGGGIEYEFDSGSSPFTWNTAPSSEDVNTTVKSHFYVETHGNNSGNPWLAWTSWSPPSTFDARMKVSLGANNHTNNCACGLQIYNSDNSNRIMCYLYRNTTGGFGANGFTYASSSYTQIVGLTPNGPNYRYLRIKREASNVIKFYQSFDGVIWEFMGTTTFSITVARIGLYMDSGAGGSNESYGAVDWIRTNS